MKVAYTSEEGQKYSNHGQTYKQIIWLMFLMLDLELKNMFIGMAKRGGAAKNGNCLSVDFVI